MNAQLQDEIIPATEVPRDMDGNGNSSSGVPMRWLLSVIGGFGAVMLLLLGLLLQSSYNTNGQVNRIAGGQQTQSNEISNVQSQVAGLQNQLSTVQQEMLSLAQRENAHEQR